MFLFLTRHLCARRRGFPQPSGHPITGKVWERFSCLGACFGCVHRHVCAYFNKPRHPGGRNRLHTYVFAPPLIAFPRIFVTLPVCAVPVRGGFFLKCTTPEGTRFTVCVRLFSVVPDVLGEYPFPLICRACIPSALCYSPVEVTARHLIQVKMWSKKHTEELVQTIQNAEVFAGVLFRCAVVTFVLHPLQLLYLSMLSVVHVL